MGSREARQLCNQNGAAPLRRNFKGSAVGAPWFCYYCGYLITFRSGCVSPQSGARILERANAAALLQNYCTKKLKVEKK